MDEEHIQRYWERFTKCRDTDFVGARKEREVERAAFQKLLDSVQDDDDKRPLLYTETFDAQKSEAKLDVGDKGLEWGEEEIDEIEVLPSYSEATLPEGIVT